MENPTVLILNGTMYVNGQNRALAEHPDRLAAWQHAKGFWSTDDFSHPFLYATGYEAYLREAVMLSNFIARFQPGPAEEIKREYNVTDVTQVYKAWCERFLGTQDYHEGYKSMSDYYQQRERCPLPDAINILKATAEIVLAKVSRHAMSSVNSLIAEVYAGRLLGKDYDVAVLQLYSNHGGPEL